MKTAKAHSTGRRFRGLDREQRIHLRRGLLIEAGLELFGRKGYHNAGVREICAEAKLTERYFYESFHNREALFQAVYDRAIESVRTAALQAIDRSNRDVRTLARTTIRACLETLRDDPRLARIMMIDALTVSADVGRQSQLATQSFADLVGSLILSLYPKLPKRNIDAQLLANGLVGSTVYLLMHWAFNDFTEPLDTILEHCVLFYDAASAEAERLAASSRRS